MKKIAIVLLTGILVTGVSHGAALSFFNVNSSDFVTGDGTSGPAQAGWAVGAFIESGGGSGFQWDTDTLYDSTVLSDPGDGNLRYFYGGSSDSLGGTEMMYVVFFSQSTIPGGGNFSYSEAVNNPYAMSGAPKDNVDFGGDSSWVLVPEPGSFALFGLGMIALVAGSKLRKK